MSPLCISSVILVVNGYQYISEPALNQPKRRELDPNEIKNHSGGTNLYVRLEHAREQSMQAELMGKRVLKWKELDTKTDGPNNVKLTISAKCHH